MKCLRASARLENSLLTDLASSRRKCIICTADAHVFRLSSASALLVSHPDPIKVQSALGNRSDALEKLERLLLDSKSFSPRAVTPSHNQAVDFSLNAGFDEGWSASADTVDLDSQCRD
jgi:hypothetical protein